MNIYEKYFEILIYKNEFNYENKIDKYNADYNNADIFNESNERNIA